ncbi:MAG: MFS transporter [Dictyoglomi bacterium]|nr:MFS transporter [Dictyoglomota bacterium]HHV80545.1 MFS transporter [bacterium]HOL54456.1 MFS transporter [bacterium]HPC76915.1 MFS transporter [bacterium]HPO81478.1 MFS transporter [bacterium]
MQNRNTRDVEEFVARYYKRNFIVNSLDMAFFSFGSAFYSISTIFPVLIKNLGGSNIHIGLLPAIANLGWSIPSIIGAKMVAGSSKKLPFILRWTIGERLPYLIIAFLLIFLVPSNPSLAMYLALFLLFIATFTGGILSPAWLDYIAKIIPPSRRGTIFSIGFGMGGVLGILASFLARRFLEIYPFPYNFSYCFICAGIALGISYLFLALAKEPEVTVESDDLDLVQYIKSLPFILRSDKNFTLYIIARALSAFGSMGVGFYTVYSLNTFNLHDGYAGIFSAFLLGSQTIATFLLGPIGDLKGHKLILSIGILSIILGYLSLVIDTTLWMAYLAFILMGINYSAFGTSGMAIIMDLAPEEKRPVYAGLSNTLMGPFSFAAPIIGGVLANRFGYKPMFIIGLSLSVLSFTIITFLVKEPRNTQQKYQDTD